MSGSTHGLELGVSIGYLTLSQAAAIKGCSTDTLRSRVRAGQIPVHWLDQRTPLVSVADLTAVQVRGHETVRGTAGHAQ
jgi:hypothetical protein